MTKDEALKLALEALENSVDLVREDAYNAEKLYGNYPTRQGKVRGLKVLADDHEKAITAIKQALANDAFDKKAENARELGLDYEPAPVQEPVGYLFQHEETGLTTVVDVQQVEWGFEKNNPRHQKIGPVYTTPPAAQPAPDLQDELDATNRQVEILSDALAESRREVAALQELNK